MSRKLAAAWPPPEIVRPPTEYLMITNERQKTTHSSQFLDQRARSPSGQQCALSDAARDGSIAHESEHFTLAFGTLTPRGAVAGDCVQLRLIARLLQMGANRYATARQSESRARDLLPLPDARRAAHDRLSGLGKCRMTLWSFLPPMAGHNGRGLFSEDWAEFADSIDMGEITLPALRNTHASQLRCRCRCRNQKQTAGPRQAGYHLTNLCPSLSEAG